MQKLFWKQNSTVRGSSTSVLGDNDRHLKHTKPFLTLAARLQFCLKYQSVDSRRFLRVKLLFVAYSLS